LYMFGAIKPTPKNAKKDSIMRETNEPRTQKTRNPHLAAGKTLLATETSRRLSTPCKQVHRVVKRECKTAASVTGLEILFGQSAFSWSSAAPSMPTRAAADSAVSRPFELEPMLVKMLADLGLQSASVTQAFVQERVDCEQIALMSHDRLQQLGVTRVSSCGFAAT
jgi:hypothetical protein